MAKKSKYVHMYQKPKMQFSLYFLFFCFFLLFSLSLSLSLSLARAMFYGSFSFWKLKGKWVATTESPWIRHWY